MSGKARTSADRLPQDIAQAKGEWFLSDLPGIELSPAVDWEYARESRIAAAMVAGMLERQRAGQPVRVEVHRGKIIDGPLRSFRYLAESPEDFPRIPWRQLDPDVRKRCCLYDVHNRGCFHRLREVESRFAGRRAPVQLVANIEDPLQAIVPAELSGLTLGTRRHMSLFQLDLKAPTIEAVAAFREVFTKLKEMAKSKIGNDRQSAKPEEARKPKLLLRQLGVMRLLAITTYGPKLRQAARLLGYDRGGKMDDHELLKSLRRARESARAYFAKRFETDEIPKSYGGN